MDIYLSAFWEIFLKLYISVLRYPWTWTYTSIKRDTSEPEHVHICRDTYKYGHLYIYMEISMNMNMLSTCIERYSCIYFQYQTKLIYHFDANDPRGLTHCEIRTHHHPEYVHIYKVICMDINIYIKTCLWAWTCTNLYRDISEHDEHISI